MPDKPLELTDGMELSSGQITSNMGDITYFVNAGGVVFATTYGKRRMSFVPVVLGEAYQAARVASIDEERTAAASRLLAELGVDPMAVHAHRHSINDSTDRGVPEEARDG